MADNLQLTFGRFRAAAGNFIETVDSNAAYESEAFLIKLSHDLAELYTAPWIYQWSNPTLRELMKPLSPQSNVQSCAIR
jgi:hypothetical protein